jgi:Family of unknown function (DUF5372)
VLLARRPNWGEDRVMFFNEQGRLCSMLASWTSLAERDLFDQASAGRSWFRPDDLLRLSALVDEVTRQTQR